MPSTAIKAISLDLDDTLWASAPVLLGAEQALHAWLEERAPGVAAALPPPLFAQFRRSLAAELPAIAHDFTALRHEALRRALSLHGEDPQLADEAFEVFIAARCAVELYPDVPIALERLARRFKLIALSNGNADVERIGIANHFTCIVSARVAGVAKPDPRIFHAACARVDFHAGELLHAGDDPELDVRAAARAGLTAAWINRARAPWPGEPAQYVEFHDLAGLAHWLGA
jgi:HAD superfamily hydrolase (TIGR01549 family)